MKLPVFSLCVFACTACAFDLDDFLDRLDNTLTVAAFHGNLRARLSGTIELEFYHFEQPPPGLINSRSDNLFNPGLTLFLDAQIGSQIYFFAQSQLDRGFDPSDQGADVRLDEYALGVTPWEDGRFTMQIGKFATVVGNWVPRHLPWENPFINAPLIYENVTAIRDKDGRLPAQFEPGLLTHKYVYNPVIWGPDYASGISVSGRIGKVDYAAEMKNSSLSSRPESWDVTAIGFSNPTFNARLGYRPSQPWNFGLSVSRGTYFRPEAQRTLPRDQDIGDFPEFVLGQDISFAWHHLQIWAEFYQARFEVPEMGNADTFAYYVEAKYKFTPQFYGALRWGQQLFASVENRAGASVRWGQDLARIDLAAGYRFTSYTQLKLQYSFQDETSGSGDQNHLIAGQFILRF